MEILLSYLIILFLVSYTIKLNLMLCHILYVYRVQEI